MSKTKRKTTNGWGEDIGSVAEWKAAGKRAMDKLRKKGDFVTFREFHRRCAVTGEKRK
jgi:hypothetical protein